MVLATFNADNKSNAPAKSKPRNLLGVSPSHTLRLVVLRHDWIMAETYYGQRGVATAVSKTSRANQIRDAGREDHFNHRNSANQITHRVAM
jgi:hypothetical protein